MDEITLLKNRFSELASRSFDRGIYTNSEFLTQAEQSELLKMHFPVKVSLFGGYDNAERCIAVFGDEDDLGYECIFPVKYIKIEPLQMKFADKLTHRDFLGSLMGLGLRREMLGDIVINENVAYLVCLDTVSDFIINQLDKVKHTSVKCSESDFIPADVLPELKYEELIVSSERLDVLISAVYNLSRSDSQKRINGETVFCNSVLTVSSSHVPESGTLISVRGLGRFIYDGVLRQTKKGRNVIAVRIY
ncbi:MAG: hypothetical protein IJ289_00670 [Clostridia bacterium]|nr:hypothetical protein [Clostridia bacterium]